MSEHPARAARESVHTDPDNTDVALIGRQATGIGEHAPGLTFAEGRKNRIGSEPK
ncbi:MAG: hypothetical protein J0H19_11095 [Rhodospirillales bacterium]|nr:hypothetical protein [Rhodospirillales bacterium]MBN8927156.1 hypothetical protein [Rhodospirillales bacterium]